MSKVNKERPYAHALNKLRDAGLRPTRQRLALAKLLFDGHDRHVTAEMLYEEAGILSASVSLATVYNTLHQFTDVGLLREVVVDSGRTYFDTNTSDHYHFFHEEDGRLEDVPLDAVEITSLPQAPAGKEYSRVAVVIHVKDAGN